MFFFRLFFLNYFLFCVCINAQNEICENPMSNNIDPYEHLKTINKCLIENENTSSNTHVAPNSNRYLRKRTNSYLLKIKESLSIVDAKQNANRDAESTYISLKMVTQEPVLLLPDNNANYQGNLKTILKKYVNDHITYPQEAKDKGIEGTVWTSFVIDTNGNITNIVTAGPIGAEILEKQAEKLIQSLPKFSPGKIKDQAVNVQHLMTIDFNVTE